MICDTALLRIYQRLELSAGNKAVSPAVTQLSFPITHTFNNESPPLLPPDLPNIHGVPDAFLTPHIVELCV